MNKDKKLVDATLKEVVDTEEKTNEFELMGLEIEEDMPNDLKETIKRYNHIHANFLSDLAEESKRKTR